MTSNRNPAALSAEYMKKVAREDGSSNSDIKTHFLYPGQICTSSEPAIISTILGSCAAICLWDKRQRIGGMNHYLLAEGDGPDPFRYGSHANPALLQQLVSLGCRVGDLQAKIFGGSSSFSNRREESLGTKNVELAEEFVRINGIPLVLKNVSGNRGRRLVFYTYDGMTSIKIFDKA
jgi:chemotaxis receptor (MCP) glutamine deamidase CheD